MSDPPPLPPPPFWRTIYYETIASKKVGRLKITTADIQGVLDTPARRIQQANGRWRLWGRDAADRHWLRVILLDDNETVHNAHYDRKFRP